MERTAPAETAGCRLPDRESTNVSVSETSMEIVLHHTIASPFAELGRLALGFKQLDYVSVIIPNVLPKPELAELTGGYVRTPVLQIGADIFCDTAAIFDALDAYSPDPPFYPAPLGDMHRLVANWAGGPQFITHIAAAFGALPADAMPKAFLEDRMARFGLDIPACAETLPQNAAQVAAAADWLERILADGRAFLGGDKPGHGDLAVYINLWFVLGNAAASAAGRSLAELPLLRAWCGRVAGIGHGRPRDGDGQSAIEIAANATPSLSAAVEHSDFEPGTLVRVGTADVSRDPPIVGRLLRLNACEIAIVRDSPRAGTVVVHFPRLGQALERCENSHD